ncbi:MAG: hypothetical protein V1726_07770 [Methanobacteriota archaeon]
MDDSTHTMTLTVVFSVLVISILGIWLFSWELTRSIIPEWARILIVISLFTHLFIRVSQQTLITRKIIKRSE